jgi:fatty acid desaturase
MELIIMISSIIESQEQSFAWLTAASLPPIIYLLLKKRKGGLLQRFFAKIMMKRMMRKRKSRSIRLTDVFGALSLICLILFFVFATGGSGSELAIPMAIAFLVFLLAWAIAARKS